MTGVTPTGPGSRASHEAASASPPEASIPNAHTPLPWGVSYGFSIDLNDYGKGGAVYVGGPNPNQIGIKLATPWIEGAWDDDEEAKANAAFIVRACNAHYALVAALEAILPCVGSPVVLRDTPERVRAACAALAKARGDA